MHIAGINWIAVLVAAAAFFSIGFVIHLKLVDLEAWDAAKHTDQAKLSKARMASGMVLPLATAIGLAVLFGWADVTGVGNGIKWGLVVALASGLPVLWYNWFYGTAPAWIFWVDSAHQTDGSCRRGRDIGRLALDWRVNDSD